VRIVDQEYALIPVDALEPHPNNPRRGDLEVISESVEHNGFFGAVLVQKSSGRILVGEHRWRAAKAQGASHVPVLFADVDDDRALTIMLADNRASDKAGYDDRALAQLLEDVANPVGTGYDQSFIDGLLRSVAQSDKQFHTDPDAVPPPPDVPVTRPGDLWMMGEHRVLCADAGWHTSYQRLFDDPIEQSAQLALADPPYANGTDYDAYEDTEENLEALIATAGRLMLEYSEVALVTCGVSNIHRWPRPLWTLAWIENGSLGSGPWGFCCWQPVLAYGPDPFLARGMGRRPDTYQGTSEGHSNQEHPVAKPMRVWRWLIERGSVARGDIVLDPFLGSGTTLIACEELGRICFGIEFSPSYVDVTVRRWEEFTGERAVRVESEGS
jgi:hypothetical protein